MDIDPETLSQLKKVVNFVLKSPLSSFYRQKYQIDQLRSPQDFFQLSYLTKQEIVAVDPLKRLYLPFNSTEMVSLTSGTSGSHFPTVMLQNKTHPVQEADILKKILDQKVKYYLFLLPPLAGHARLLRWDFLRKHNIVRVLGDLNNLPLTAKLMASLKIDAIESTASILYFFLPYLKKEYDLKKIKYIALGGEYCSEQKAQFLRKNFPNAYFRFQFGGSETGPKAYRCPYMAHLPVRFFHPLPIFYFETPDSGEGEALLTHLTKEVSFPLIRYATGDYIKITHQPCRCGNTTFLEVFGKLDFEVSKVAGTTIYAQAVYQALEPVQKCLMASDFRLHIFEVWTKGQLQTKLKLQLIPKVTKDQDKLKTKIAEQVSQYFYLSPTTTLTNLVEKNVFLPLEVEFVSSFPIDGKRKHIIFHTEAN